MSASPPPPRRARPDSTYLQPLRCGTTHNSAGSKSRTFFLASCCRVYALCSFRYSHGLFAIYFHVTPIQSDGSKISWYNTGWLIWFVGRETRRDWPL